MRLPWDSDVSESEGTQAEDIEGAEYANRSVDGSQSGQSLQGFFDDQDSDGIQGPSFYRALNNEGDSPTSPFANWSTDSAFGKPVSVSPSLKRKRKSFQGEGARCPEEACLEEDIGGLVLTGRALARKRRRTVLSQESEGAEEKHVPTLQPVSPELGVATGNGHDVNQQFSGSAAGELHFKGPFRTPSHPAVEPRFAAAEPTPLVEAAGGSKSSVPKAGPPAKKKSHKRATHSKREKPIPAPMDEAARVDIQAAREAHFRTLEGLRPHPNGQETTARRMPEAQGGGNQCAQVAAAAETVRERSRVDVTVPEVGEEDQQGGERFITAVRQSIQHSPREALRHAEELERRQDARQRLQGTPAENSSDASSRSSVAEAGEPSAAPNFDPRSRLATCASVGDELEGGQDVRQSLRGIAVEVVSRAARPSSVVDADQPSITPNRNEPSLEDEPGVATGDGDDVCQQFTGSAAGELHNTDPFPASPHHADELRSAATEPTPSIEVHGVSTSGAPKTGRPTKKKLHKRVKPIPAPAMVRRMFEAQGGGHRAAQEAVAAEAPGERPFVDATVAQVREEEQQSGRKYFDKAMRQSQQHSPREAIGQAEEFERGQDACQRFPGIPPDNLSSATSLAPGAEAGEPSAAPNFDLPSRSAAWASIEADLQPGRGEGSDERQQLQAIAAEVVSRATIPPPDVMAGQRNTSPNPNEPPRLDSEASFEDGFEGSQDERQQLRGFAARDLNSAATPPPVVDAGQPSTAPTRNEPSRPRDQASIEDDGSSVDPRPGQIVVHEEHGGKLLTVKKAELGTFFFAKRKFDDKVDYQDAKNGPQGCCRRHGEVLGHQVEIRRLRPSREFGSYPDWPSAYPNLRDELHLEEAIKAGCPCKPYLDLERDGGLPDGETLETVIGAFEEAIKAIFESEYGLELPKEAFNWIPCDYGPGGKFSLHLVISSHSPQFVYRSNLAPPADPQGAGHLARKFGLRLPDCYAELIDQSVYTRNRGIRLPFCSKPSNPHSRLIPLDESKPYADACITWFDDHVQAIKVPDVLLRAVRPRERPENPGHLNPRAASMYEVQRCTELIQNLHPTAYHRGSANSLNFSWHDRSEPCYSGHVHAGGRDILCVADCERNAVFAVCSSERVDPETGVCCKNLPAKYLGPYWVDNETWKDGAAEIDLKYLDRDPLAAAPMDLALIRAGVRPLTDKVVFNDIVNKWLEGRYKTLPIRSPMGSGKSMLLAALLAEVSRSA
ncbi:hypothetical protein KFL_005780015 [Klebsormidium nitens]|uniref:Uncharacterized protein n=1 Tax=Klebsormidium nitens TaxID=105231 RepID=A0A1Y1IH03_KLENI|nr:hypothetical protein KFL_005780015 [Klebsormidium nitens]|eukprot:GAQ89923.1 hypothetical protein KFL_005780015 [Klebsormidium nitens]